MNPPPPGYEQARGRGRDRRAVLTALSNVGAKFVTIFISFATIPLTLHYLGSERFGLWMTVSSFSALLAFADLGIGNGLINVIAKAHGHDDRAALRRAVSSAFVVLTALALILLLPTLLMVALIDWTTLFNLRDALAIQEIKPALVAFVVCFALSIPLGIAARVQLGLQMGVVNGIWLSIGSVLALLAVLLVIHLNGGLTWLVVALLGAPLMASAANSIIFFQHSCPDLQPRIADISYETMGTLVRVGGLFFLLQLAGALAYSADYTIAARFAGAAAVGDFAIAAKLFSVATIVIALLLQPLWPAYGEAIARRDLNWVRRTLWRSTAIVALLSASAACILFFWFERIVELWLHSVVLSPIGLLTGFALWAVVDAVGNSLAMFLNGAHVVSLQLFLASAFAVTCLTLKIILVPHFGTTALPWTTLLVYIAVVLLPVLISLSRLLERTLGR